MSMVEAVVELVRLVLMEHSLYRLVETDSLAISQAQQ
jgi:hypothetical protein